jgi:hypothetical protein
MVKNHPSFISSVKILSDYMNFSALETDCSISDGKQCIVLANPDIGAGKELCSALANDNRAGFYSLAAKQLNAPVLGVAVPAISGRALSLFMCHVLSPLFCVNFPSKSIKRRILTD